MESSSWSFRIVLSLKKLTTPVNKVITDIIKPMSPKGPHYR